MNFNILLHQSNKMIIFKLSEILNTQFLHFFPLIPQKKKKLQLSE